MAQRNITDKELEDLKEQLTRMRNDRDRLRLITVTADQFFFTTDQVVDLVEVQHYGEAQRTTAIALYPSTVDQEHFQRVIDCYKFKEDQQEIKDALGL